MVIGYSKNLCLHYHIRSKSRTPAAFKWFGISPVFLNARSITCETGEDFRWFRDSSPLRQEPIMTILAMATRLSP